MSDVNNSEKRKFPRLQNHIPLKLFKDEGDVVTETVNISRSGAYCRVNCFIEPMTKIKTVLLLPIRKGSKSVTKKITCQGIVVRSEKDEHDDVYNIAIFFSDISQRDAETIGDYVSSFVEKQSE